MNAGILKLHLRFLTLGAICYLKMHMSANVFLWHVHAMSETVQFIVIGQPFISTCDCIVAIHVHMGTNGGCVCLMVVFIYI